jgi:cystathionine beta-lyase/cystathionine gamma-synthase
MRRDASMVHVTLKEGKTSSCLTARVPTQAATFGQPSATVGGPYDYTRSGNPTRTLLEEQIAQLEVRLSGPAHACPCPCSEVTTETRDPCSTLHLRLYFI